MKITVENCQKKVPLNLGQIRKTIQKILKLEKVAHATLSIVFVTPKSIQSLNKKFLGSTHITDVLSFDLTSDAISYQKTSKRIKRICGDIYICPQMALKQRLMYQTSLDEEVTLYVVHGILHLLGYDDHADKDILQMRKKEKQLMARL